MSGQERSFFLFFGFVLCACLYASSLARSGVRPSVSPDRKVGNAFAITGLFAVTLVKSKTVTPPRPIWTCSPCRLVNLCLSDVYNKHNVKKQKSKYTCCRKKKKKH